MKKMFGGKRIAKAPPPTPDDTQSSEQAVAIMQLQARYTNQTAWIALDPTLTTIVADNREAQIMFATNALIGRSMKDFVAPGQPNPHTTDVDFVESRDASEVTVFIGHTQGIAQDAKGRRFPVIISDRIKVPLSDAMRAKLRTDCPYVICAQIIREQNTAPLLAG